VDVISVSQCNIFHLGHLCSSPFSIFCPTTWMYLYLCYLTKHSLNFSQSLFSLPLTWLTAHGCPLNLGVVLEPPTHIYTYIRMYSIYQGKITKDSGAENFYIWCCTSDGAVEKSGRTKWGLLSLRLAHGSYIQNGERISLTVKFNLKIQILWSPFSFSVTSLRIYTTDYMVPVWGAASGRDSVRFVAFPAANLTN